MKFEVPQRRQLASERTSLTLFAPAPSTISFVPLTRNLSLADSSPYPVRGWTGLSETTATRFSVLRTTKCDAFSEARRTKNRLLRYGIRIRCSKSLPGVREAFSEAFGVKNRLLRYGRDIRYRKRPSTVRNRHSATKKGSWGTRCVFKGPQNSTCHIERIFKGPQNSRLHRLWTASCRTGRIFRGVPCQKQHLPQRQHLQCAKRPRSLCSLRRPLPLLLRRHSVPETAHRSEVSKYKKRMTSKSIKTF